MKIEESIIHSKSGDYAAIKHLKLHGSNREIGIKLGELAKNYHKINRPKWHSDLTRRCQIDYLRKNYPIHFERMNGFAEAYGEDICETNYDFTSFGLTPSLDACSAVYYPPKYTESKTGIISRNADLPLISFPEMMTGENPINADKIMSKPYIVEMYPDKGYASLIVFCFELYGLALDGINSEGLAVVHLHADDINEDDYKPSGLSGVGINEMLVVQLLLDNCKNVEEAKELILTNKHYRMLLPTHLLIADKNGDSFIWEYPVEHNQDLFIDGDSEIQIITNFPVHQYPNSDSFPESIDQSCSFARYKTLENALRDKTGKLSTDDMKEINSKVFIADDMFAEKLPFPIRTIYHNIYNTNNKSMEISFFRRDTDKAQERTEYFEFKLG